MEARFLREPRAVAVTVLAVLTLLFCWNGVSWALRPGLFLWADELGNLPWLMETPYRAILHVLPQYGYNDRPTGQALERALYELFGFDYRRQLSCFLCIHFANCALVLLLFRRLGVSLPVSLAATAFFGSLSTTAQAATYIGASFDVLCTFFLLGSILTALARRWWWWYSSACLFLLALRSKEFAIMTPVLLTVLLVGYEWGSPWKRIVTSLGRRLWLHYLILLIFGLRYLSFLTAIRASLIQHGPYYVKATFGTVISSLCYYAALIFTLEYSGVAVIVTGIGLLVMLAYAIWRRHSGIVFGIAAYILTLLPVALLPNIRQPPYVYGPQIFLILAICLCLESVLAMLPTSEIGRRAGTICIAVLLLAGAYAIRTSAYFQERINWCRAVRATCAATARDAAVQLSGIGPGAHIYLDSGDSTPWLMMPGPCDYLRLLRRDRTIACVIQKPETVLRELYDRDVAEKYFVEYREDGSLRIRLTRRALRQ
jgi:hypothetical protein